MKKIKLNLYQKKDMEDREIEWRWIDVNIDNVRKLLKKHNATLVYQKTIMPLITFTHPTGNDDSYIRIRYEGTHISMTSKTDLKSEYVKEFEVIIDNFEQGIKILTSLGCKKKYYLEKIRETWKMPGCKEIVIDSYPGTYQFLEIDAYSEEVLKKTAKLLGLSRPSFPLKGVSDIYREEYGMTENRKMGDLTFQHALKNHRPYIKKNLNIYKKRLKEQQKYYDLLKFDVSTIYHIIDSK